MLPENDSVQLKGTHTLLGHQHEIAHLKPLNQGDFGILKDGATQHGEAEAVAATTAGLLTDPMKGP
jgi:hypothetical protein